MDASISSPIDAAESWCLKYENHDHMALRVEKAFGVSMDTLMRMQNSYDIAQARKREGEINVAPFKGKPLDSQAALI